MRPPIDGQVIHETAPLYGMGAGGLKGLLEHLPADLSARELEAMADAMTHEIQRRRA